jgi:hypothetical protein
LRKLGLRTALEAALEMRGESIEEWNGGMGDPQRGSKGDEVVVNIHE